MNNEEESIPDYDTNNELVGADRTIATIDYVLQQSKLVGWPLVSLNVTIFIDQTTKHTLTTNNGYNMAVVGDTLNLVCMHTIYIISSY